MKLDSSVGCFIILFSILGGFLIGEPLLNATGLLKMQSMSPNAVQELKLACWIGCVIFGSVLILYGIRTLLYFSFLAIERLDQVKAKPNGLLAFAFVLCGTLCLLGVIGLEVVTVILDQPRPGITTQVNSNVVDGNSAFSAYVAGHPSGVRIFAHFFASLVFIAGTALVALGIWSAIPAEFVPKPKSVQD